VDFVISFKCDDDLSKKLGGSSYCLVSSDFLEAVRVDINRDLTVPAPEILQQDVSFQHVKLEEFR
jgi:hypothetical protein